MANKKIHDFKAGRLFSPSFVRGKKSDMYAAATKNKIVKGFIGNSESTASFRHSSKSALKSTQQIPLDYSLFQNHTFFDSAESKVNIAFSHIFNEYPFDGSNKEIEDFEDKMSGFDKYVYENIPKNVGYLYFSGTQTGEIGSNGTYIAVSDSEGLKFPNFSRNASGKSILDPKGNSFTFEMQLFIPETANDNQTVVQKRSSLANNITLALSESASTSNCNLIFGVTSGSSNLYVETTVQKGQFNYISAQFVRSVTENRLKVFNNSLLVATSSNSYEMGEINFNNQNLIIGSGSNVRINNLIFTPEQTLSGAIDDFRYYHNYKSIDSVARDQYISVNRSDDLKLYFKFNEPTGSYGANSVVLDYSGNSLHSIIQNFNSDLRDPGSLLVPLTREDLYRSPVLFSDVDTISNLNIELLTSASEYDSVNPNLITKLVPVHYFLEGQSEGGWNNQNGTLSNPVTQNGIPGTAVIGSAQNLITFLLIWARHFDQLKIFVDHFSKIYSIDYEENDHVADSFLKYLGQHYNIPLPRLFDSSDEIQFVNGDLILGEQRRAQRALKEIQNTIWRRILVNASEFRQTKGTVHSVKAALRAAGVDIDNIFEVREYGGSTVKTLSGSRKDRKEVNRLLSFSGSLAQDSGTLNAQGISSGRPFLISPFLSGSRIETGFPEIAGTFINKSEPDFPHGISNDPSDGLFTSGSFSFEALYRFKQLITGSYPTTQSLARIAVTGSDASAANHGVVFNLLLISGSSPSVHLLGRPSTATTSEDTLHLKIYSASLFDGDQWSVSFSRDRLTNSVSSSYSLKVGKQESGKLVDYYTTASFFLEPSDGDQSNNVLQKVTSQFNASGSMLLFGSQSLNTSGDYFLNASSQGILQKTTNFSGELNFIRFWSKDFSNREWKEHVRNYKSRGVINPNVNYNFSTHLTGAFQRMRLDTIGRQATTASDNTGGFRLFDFSQNNLHLAGTGFEASTTVVKPDFTISSEWDPKFDVSSGDQKVRIRSLQDQSRFNANPFARIGPVYEIPSDEISNDDARFTIDLSTVKALNEDIMTLFSDLDYFDDNLGQPNLIFGESYQEIENLRETYFNNLTGKIDLMTYSNLFKWFNAAYSELVYSMIPSKTKFLGINFVVESHVLERHRLRYLFDQIYLRSIERNSNPGNLLLSQFVGRLRRY